MFAYITKYACHTLRIQTINRILLITSLRLKYLNTNISVHCLYQIYIHLVISLLGSARRLLSLPQVVVVCLILCDTSFPKQMFNNASL